MNAVRYYVRHRDEIKFTAAFLGMVIAAGVLSDMLVRAIENSPLISTAAYVFSRVGMSAAAPALLVLGMFVTALIALALDQTKRPQSVVLGVVTAIGLVTLAIHGRLFGYIQTNDLALLVLGVAAGVLYIGPDTWREMVISDPGHRSESILTAKRTGQLEFRTAERLVYLLLTGVVVFAFFEAYTQYEPLLYPNLFPNVGAISSFQLVFPSNGQMGIDLAAIAVGLLTAYGFLGYDAVRSYFIAGPSRSGKTHSVVALHQEAVNQGFNPRNESPRLLDLKAELVNEDGFLSPTDLLRADDISFTFTSKGFLRKNIHVNAIDYSGELLKYILPISRYYTEPEHELIDEYVEISEVEGWLQRKIDERVGDLNERTPESRTDGGTDTESASAETATDDREDSFSDIEDEGDSPSPSSPSSSDPPSEEVSDARTPASSVVNNPGVKTVESHLLPAFHSADSLLLIVDLVQLRKPEESTSAEELLRLYNESDKDAIVLATKADTIEEEFKEARAWKTAWAREPYDEFRTYVQNEFYEHDLLRSLLDDIPERPYPVGYRTVETGESDGSSPLSGGRRFDDSTVGEYRVEALGYDYLLERMN